jgi:hypothetical protein
MFTVICCWNDPEVYAGVLQASLADQAPHQLLAHRNTAEENTPIPIIYNRLATEAAGEWLLFVHQDVRLLPGCLAQLEHKLDTLERTHRYLGVAGLAGATPDGWLQNGTSDVESYKGYHVQVQTLDECLLACRPGLLQASGGFAEREALAWHCYGIQLCLEAAELGWTNYVVQILARHEGPHRVSHEKLELLRSAQRWVAVKWRKLIGSSGGRLKLMPEGNMQLALAQAIDEGLTRGVASMTWRTEAGYCISGGEQQ